MKPNKHNMRLLLLSMIAAALVTSMMAPAQAGDGDDGGDGDDAEIEVEWHEDGQGFDVESSKGLSNIIVLLCPPGETHKHEEFEDEGRDGGDGLDGELLLDGLDGGDGEVHEWTHREDHDILAIWVKSGNNHDPEGTAPPPPFDNPGAGAYFENPNAECEEVPEEPECPSEFDATVQENGDVLLTWVPDDNAAGYSIFRQAGEGELEEIGAVGGDVDNFTDENTAAGTTYTYVIALLNEEGEVIEHCGRDTVTVPPAEEPCLGPQEVTATTMTDGILIDWSAVEGADSYNVYRQTGDQDFALLTSTDGDMTAFKDADVEAGVAYTYTVTAMVDGQETESCDEATATGIPVFPTLVAGSLAVLGAVGAYAGLKRRRN